MALVFKREWFTNLTNGTFDGATLIAYPTALYNYQPSFFALTTEITNVGSFAVDSLKVTLKNQIGFPEASGLSDEYVNGRYMLAALLYGSEYGLVTGNRYDFTGKIKVDNILPALGTGNMSLYAEFRGVYYKLSNVNLADEGNYLDVSFSYLSTITTSNKVPIQIFLVWDEDVLGDNAGASGTVQLDNLGVKEYEPELTPLTVTGIVTNVTSNGGSDGQIALTIGGGSGNTTILWDDATNDNPKINLIANIYTVEVTDNITAEVVTVIFEVNEPVADAPIVGTTFYVPTTQSIRMVEEVIPNNCETFQNADNVLFCKEFSPYYVKKDYYQKVAKCDLLNMQFRSNYPNHEARLLDYRTGVEIVTFPITLERANTGVESQYNIRIENHGNSQSRVYFSGGGALPIPLVEGSSFEIVNNADGINGRYEIIQILDDTLLGSQYLVINFSYVLASPSSLAEGVFVTNVLDYNVYQFPMDLGVLSNGLYKVEVNAMDSGLVIQRTAISEPIELDVVHENTLYFEFNNIDNAFDIDYQTGITGKVRVEARNFKRVPSQTKETIRNTDGELKTLISKPQRKFLIEFYQLPPYLHEKLSVIFQHDNININGVAFQTEEGYEEPQYLLRYPLANAQIIVEQSNWFTTYNTDNVGGVNGEPAGIIANEALILR